MRKNLVILTFFCVSIDICVRRVGMCDTQQNSYTISHYAAL